MTLDEPGLRREGFAEGPKVRLRDGQEWTFPPPTLCMRLRVVDGRAAAEAALTYGATYADRLDDLMEAEDPVTRLAIQLELAATLLLRNYSLSERELRPLLSIDLADDGDTAMWEEINPILLGDAPKKPTAVGSDTPSSPTASTPTD